MTISETLNRIAEYRRESIVWESGKARIATRDELRLHPMAMHPIDCAKELLRELRG
jgi:hypothetical protein